jgi:alkaline phosphatase
MRLKSLIWLAALISAPLPLPAAAQTALETKPLPAPKKKAKNVILFIGDGMGISTITAARIYDGQSRGETGEENSLSFEAFPNVALVKTYNSNQQVPDSAGTATAMNSAGPASSMSGRPFIWAIVARRRPIG